MDICNTLMYIVYHDESSKKIAEKYEKEPWARLLYIETTKYLESYAYKLLKDRENEWKNKKYVGVIKYNFEEKTSFFDFDKLCENSDADVLTFVGPESHSPDTQGMSMIKTARKCHPYFPTIWAHILMTNFGIDGATVFSDEIPAFYSNFWIAKSTFFYEYVNSYDIVYKIMETDEIIKPILNTNALYFQRIDSHKLVEINNVPYYTYHPFVMERLPCFVLWYLKAKIKAVINEERLTIQEQFFQKAYPNRYKI